MFLHGHRLSQAIVNVASNGPADMAVAFWGNDAHVRLKLPANLTGYRIICDARSGACSPVALGEMLKRGAIIVDLPGVHAKLYQSPVGLVVGSANASARGLSEDELSFGLETGVEVHDDATVAAAHRWFETAFAAGIKLRPQDMKELAALWNIARSGRILRVSLLDAILANSDAIQDRELKAYIYDFEEPLSVHEKTYRESVHANSKRPTRNGYHPYFWGEMPGTIKVGDVLLCFGVQGGHAECEGVWQVIDYIGSGDGAIWPAIPIERPLGRQLGNHTEIDRRVTRALRDERLVSGGPPISLTELAAAICDKRILSNHFAKLQAPEARAACDLLLDNANRLGLTATLTTGHVLAVRLHDQARRYVFSFIPNKGDLLFYVRLPAQEARPTLAAEAKALGLAWNVNTAGEVTLRIGTLAQARVILDWLASRLPLPVA